MRISAVTQTNQFSTSNTEGEKKEIIDTQIQQDSVSISEEGRKFLEASNEYIEMLRQLNESDNESNPVEDMGKCMKIAMHIMNGDNVPQSDVKKLMEAYPDLYKMAMLMRKENHDPEDCDKLFEDEDEASEVSESSPQDTSEASAESEVSETVSESE